MSSRRISDETLLAEYAKHITDVASMMRRTYNLDLSDQEDLEQELRIKLCSIPQEHRKHRQYVKTCINNKARDVWRCMKRHQQHTTAIDEHSAGAETHDVDGQRHVDTLLSHLTPLQQNLITMHLGLNGDPPQKLPALSHAVKMPQVKIREELDIALATMRSIVDGVEEAA